MVAVMFSFIIHIFVICHYADALSVEIRSVSGPLGENGTEIECSYTKKNVLKINSVRIIASNRSSMNFERIAVYFPNLFSLISPSAQYLKGRVTVMNITQTSEKAILIFNKLMCIDDKFYRCEVKYTDTSLEDTEKLSNIMRNLVQVSPLKPDQMFWMKVSADSSTSQNTHIPFSTLSASPEVPTKQTESPSTLDSGNQYSFNHSTIPTTDHITTSSTLSNGDLYSNVGHITSYSTQKTTRPQGIAEGDNVTVFCAGDVGNPPAKLFIEKYINGKIAPMLNTISTTSISNQSENCSYYRTTNFTFKVTAKDNKAVIRCVVNSSMAESDKLYVETERIEVYYPVRMPTIMNYPNKRQYVLGEETSLRLACKSDGNPKPSYVWYKENRSEQVSSNETFTITNMNITNSGIYTCEVNNTFHGGTYQKTANVNIRIINAADKTTPSTSGSGLNKAKDGIIIAIAIFVCFIVIGAVGFILYKRTRKKEDYTPVDGMGSNMDQIESQIPTRGVLPSNSNKKSTGYEDIDLDDTDMKFKPVNKEETIAQVKQHNEEYLKKLKEDEDREKDNTITPPQAAVYACVNKPKNTVATENKLHVDQQDEDVYEDSKEGLYDTSGDRRHKENINAENIDSTQKLKSEDHDHIDSFSEQKSQNGAYINKAFENDREIKEEKRQVATVSPTVRLSIESKGYGINSESYLKQPANLNQHVKPEDLTDSTEKQDTHETSL